MLVHRFFSFLCGILFFVHLLLFFSLVPHGATNSYCYSYIGYVGLDSNQCNIRISYVRPYANIRDNKSANCAFTFSLKNVTHRSYC
jgi:hypothetical protein